MSPSGYGSAERKATPGGNSNKVHRAPHLVERAGGQRNEVTRRMPDSSYRRDADAYLDLTSSYLTLPAPVLPKKNITLRSASELAFARVIKRAVDVIGALTLGILFSPLMISVSIMLYWSGGGVTYRHKRVGVGGKVFDCLKFRTMIPDAERTLHELLANNEHLKAEWLRGHKLRNDPRVTALGRFLRRTSLDELPQLWNVLRGEMSLVGPRPVVREELLRYGRSSLAYVAVRPGITGLWQTMGRNDTDYRRRVAMDVYYVRNQTLLLDVYILAKTVRVVLAGNGAY